jgi:hypothetical protein
MYRLTRISAEPASPLKIMIAKPDGEDAGLTAGGSFVVEPGDVIQVDAYVAGLIMGDPGLSKHFESLPEWKPAGAEPAPEPAPEPATRKAGTSKLTAKDGKITRDDGKAAW